MGEKKIKEKFIKGGIGENKSSRTEETNEKGTMKEVKRRLRINCGYTKTLFNK